MPTNTREGSKTNPPAIRQNTLILLEPSACLEASEILHLIELQVEDVQSHERTQSEAHLERCVACKSAYKTFVLVQKLATEVEVLETVAAQEERTSRYLLPLTNTGTEIKREPRLRKKASTS